MSKLCSVPECTPGTVYALGLCLTHYTRKRRNRPEEAPRKSHDRDTSGRKECSVCLVWLPEASFDARTLSNDGLNSRCRECNADTNRWSIYRMTKDQFEALKMDQGCVCAICGKHPDHGRGWHVDHDHNCCPGAKSCGKCVRGLLCHSCNTGIGALGDDPAMLESALKYLYRTKDVLS